MASEKQIENAILAYLHEMKIFAWKNDVGGVYDPTKKVFRKKHNKYYIKGVSDILGVLPDGTFLAIEVKCPKLTDSEGNTLQQKTYPTAVQKEFIKKVEENGGIATICRSVAEVKDLLQECGYLYDPRDELH